MKYKKLYHANTNHRVEYGDIFHLSGIDCYYFGCLLYSPNMIVVLRGQNRFFVPADKLCLEWR